MAIHINQSDRNFDEQFKALLSLKRESSPDVAGTVRDIINDVHTRGDAALLEYTEKFDHQSLTKGALQIGMKEIDAAVDAVEAKTMEALKLAHERIHSHHARQMPADDFYSDPIGVELGSRWTPIDAVGLYVPGGTASYPSSVLMNAVPAKVAGVERVVMVVPTPAGVVSPLVLAAAKIAGVDEIYRIGGAQAVAALAYGTETIKPVSKIVGPGNAFVAEAKRQVFGVVGIDMIAGPSEVLVIADGDNDPNWIAADLLAQAEHDASAQSILITDDPKLAEDVEAAVDAQLQTLPRKDIARESWEQFGAIIIINSLDQAADLANQLAAEHLEIMTDDPDAILADVRNAGAVFLGRYTPEAIGDYVGGSNHVLPTSRSAKFSSGLSVLDYVKRTSILRCNPEQLDALGPAAMALAEAEGLEAHRNSVAIRSNQKV